MTIEKSVPTVKLAVTVALLLPAVVTKALGGMVLIYGLIAAVADTVKDMLQLPGSNRLPAGNATDVAPTVAVAVPKAELHVLERLLGVATTMPAGRLSVKAVLRNSGFVLELPRVRVSVAV